MGMSTGRTPECAAEPPGGLVKTGTGGPQSDTEGLGWGLGTCIYYRFPGVADVAGGEPHSEKHQQRPIPQISK